MILIISIEELKYIYLYKYKINYICKLIKKSINLNYIKINKKILLFYINNIYINLYIIYIGDWGLGIGLPVGCILTMAGTGSEMNAGAVITNHEQKLKIGHVFGEEVMPKFSILNPKFTFSLPKRQMVAGIYDIFNHICEQYFSGEDDNTSDYIAEALMKSLIHSSLIAVEDPENYEARSNIMWTATWALNTLISRGKSTDWMVHMIGQAVGAYTDATHGMTLSAVSLPYYRYVMPYGLKKFKRFAEEVWNISSNGLSDEQVANEGLKAMENWMKKIGVAMNISELGATEDMIDGITEGTLILEGGYKVLTKDEIRQILKKSL